MAATRGCNTVARVMPRCSMERPDPLRSSAFISAAFPLTAVNSASPTAFSSASERGITAPSSGSPRTVMANAAAVKGALATWLSCSWGLTAFGFRPGASPPPMSANTSRALGPSLTRIWES